MKPLMRVALAAIVLTIGLAISVQPGIAHKPITSPYTYNDDVFPILRERCGSCHVSGGVAPMSLMTHAEAVPWGESIRTEVLAGHMPPGAVDEAPSRFLNAATLTPREMNVLLTWVTGGTPIGAPDKDPNPTTREATWPLGPPDLELPFPTEAVVNADERERTLEFVVPTGTTERRWVRAADLQPETAAMVRAATIAVRSAGSAGTAAERMLALWLPGEAPIALDVGLGFELPASAELVVRVLYRKTWEYERKALKDRSTVGIYFAPTPAPATTVQAVRLVPDFTAVATADRFAFRRVLNEDSRALAIYPETGLNNASVKVVATRPDRTRVDLIAFHPRPDWSRRYWFREPIALPRGTTVEVTVTFDDEAPLSPLSLSPAAATRPDLSSMRLTLDVAP